LRVDGAVMFDFDRGDGGTGRICNDFCYFRVGQESDIGEMHDLDAIDVGVRFGVDEAGVAVAGVATDAFGFEGVGGVAFEAERNGEGVVAEFFYIIVDRRMRGSLGSAGKGYGLEWKGSVGSGLVRSSLR